MAWRFVVQPNGLLARFSEIVDNFTDLDMTDDEAKTAAIFEYNCGAKTADTKIDNARNNPGRWDEALRIIKDVHGQEALVEILKEIVAQAERKP